MVNAQIATRTWAVDDGVGGVVRGRSEKEAEKRANVEL
jgi:hypothetical protein